MHSAERCADAGRSAEPEPLGFKEATMNHIAKNRLMAAAAAVVLIAASATLGGCGSSKSDRAISGGAIGAGVGAAGGALTGNTLGGALLGGAAGAATGALTDEDQINLGKPAWR
jgi:osmotically inducible lipoprotein OsmB